MKRYRESFLAASVYPTTHCLGMCLVASGSSRPAITCEVHRSRQSDFHSRRLFLSGTPATASASRFLYEMCIGSPLSVREPTSFQPRRKQDGDQQETRELAAMWEHHGHDLGEHQREGTVLRNDLLSSVQGSVRHVAQRDLIRSE